MDNEEVWFSHREKKWEVIDGKFSWTDKEDIWDFDYCTVGIARTLENELICVVRSRTDKNSSYMGNKPVELRFMLGFPINKVTEPATELYTARKKIPDKKEGPRERWVCQFDDDYWIWEWARDREDISNSHIFQLYQLIKKEGLSPSINSDNIFDVDVENNDEIIPVIYQPAVDSLKNFVREVHCARKPIDTYGSYEVEVTIIFNDEHLQKHDISIVDNLYRSFREKTYGRIYDIETFKIIAKKDPNDKYFTFENIYSDNSQLVEDSIHGDKIPPPVPFRKVGYFYMNGNHPVVFVNTANHALAGHDANRRIWKWEYIPWLKNAPIIYGKKTREEINREFKK
ncbi:MAG: hypothetical protein WA130_22105 [Candidatus Methanoperedens sp.]